MEESIEYLLKEDVRAARALCRKKIDGYDELTSEQQMQLAALVRGQIQKKVRLSFFFDVDDARKIQMAKALDKSFSEDIVSFAIDKANAILEKNGYAAGTADVQARVL